MREIDDGDALRLKLVYELDYDQLVLLEEDKLELLLLVFGKFVHFEFVRRNGSEPEPGPEPQPGRIHSPATKPRAATSRNRHNAGSRPDTR